MNEEETREILDNMSEQELNDFIFFALQEVEKENQKLKTELKKKVKIIDLIAKELVKAHEWFYSEFDTYTKEDFIKYFENKAEKFYEEGKK